MALFTILGTFYDISIITLVGSNVKELELSLCGNDYGENDFICLFVSSIFLLRVAHFPKFISLYLYPPTHKQRVGWEVYRNHPVHLSFHLSVHISCYQNSFNICKTFHSCSIPLRITIKEDNPGLKNIKVDSSREIIICTGQRLR